MTGLIEQIESTLPSYSWSQHRYSESSNFLEIRSRFENQILNIIMIAIKAALAVKKMSGDDEEGCSE